MNKTIIVSVIFFCLLLVGGGIFLASKNSQPTVTGLDDFAKCLSDKGVTMYGAAWCSHCQSTKKTFGTSFEFIKYVECPVETKLCIDKGINGYPTWELSDGTKLEGEQTLQTLSTAASCPLPQPK